LKPLVSILIPAYNAEEWIAETLRSAVGQTWEPKEIIVVDDGSADRTLEIARQFASQQVRIVAAVGHDAEGRERARLADYRDVGVTVIVPVGNQRTSRPTPPTPLMRLTSLAIG